VRWGELGARIALLEPGDVDDARLLGLVAAEQPARVGIDAPFGWPAPFVEALAAYAREGRFPADVDTPTLRLRVTDRETQRVAGGAAPLSVATDYIGICAFRCARLLTALADGPVDRSGSGLPVEVYPAAALRIWGFPSRRYKGPRPEDVARRHALVDAFREATGGWLELGDAEDMAIRASDHAFDALVAAVVARAVQVGRTLAIPETSRAAARAEGWIHLPEAGSLAELGR
jgi:hypothetical protein